MHLPLPLCKAIIIDDSLIWMCRFTALEKPHEAVIHIDLIKDSVTSC